MRKAVVIDESVATGAEELPSRGPACAMLRTRRIRVTRWAQLGGCIGPMHIILVQRHSPWKAAMAIREPRPTNSFPTTDCLYANQDSAIFRSGIRRTLLLDQKSPTRSNSNLKPFHRLPPSRRVWQMDNSMESGLSLSQTKQAMNLAGSCWLAFADTRWTPLGAS